METLSLTPHLEFFQEFLDNVLSSRGHIWPSGRTLDTAALESNKTLLNVGHVVAEATLFKDGWAIKPQKDEKTNKKTPQTTLSLCSKKQFYKL